MKKKGYNRKVPASRNKEGDFVKLTNKQLAVYYWLISKAYWNSENNEDHYYLYNDDICYAQVAKELGIGSVNTIKSAFAKLEQYGRICILQNKIIIPHAELYTYLHIDLIKYLLAYSQVLGAELLLFYSILKRLYELNLKNNTQTTFYIKYFVVLLGHNPNDDNEYRKIHAYLAFLEGINLIKTTQIQKQNQGGMYTEYILRGIEQDLPINLYIEVEGEKKVNVPKELIDKQRDVVDFKI